MPFTLSCVVLVQLSHSSLPGKCTLKLYDRRFASQLREDEDAQPWNASIERKYQGLVNTGEVEQLFETWHQKLSKDILWKIESHKDWDDAHLEAYLQFICRKMYMTEAHAYSLMIDLQGYCVPMMLGRTALALSKPAEITLSTTDFTTCPGVFLQYIDGFSLTDLGEKTHNQHRQVVCEDTVRIVGLVGDRGICNRHVQTRSFLVEQNETADKRTVFMIDFGLCLFGDQFKEIREFEEWQADEDEEGAVGCLMEKNLEVLLRTVGQ